MFNRRMGLLIRLLHIKQTPPTDTQELYDARGACSYRSGEVDGHERVRGQEEVIEPQGVFELGQHVAEPGNEPRQGKDGPHLRPGRQAEAKRGVQKDGGRVSANRRDGGGGGEKWRNSERHSQ